MLGNLTYLGLQDVRVTDVGLKEIAKSWSNLTHLTLGGTDVSFEAANEIAALTNLTHIDLNGSQVNDAGLKGIAKLTNLIDLDLGGTKITNSGLKRNPESHTFDQAYCCQD